MASRTWLAISLACLIWFGYLRWFAPPVMQHPSGAAPVAETTATKTQEAIPAPQGMFGAEPNEAALVHKLSNPFMEVQFTSSGGKVAEVVLKNYKTTIKKDADPIHTVSSTLSGYTLGAIFSDPQLSGLSSSQFASQVNGNTVEFTNAANGIKITKQYTLSSDSYSMDAVYKITFPDSALASGKSQFGFLSIPLGAKSLEYSAQEPLKHWEVVYLQNDKVARTHWDKLEEAEKVLQGSTQWLGFGNRYFSTVVVNHSELNPDVVLTKTEQFKGGYLRFPIVLKQGQKEVEFKLQFYSGPKDVNQLSKIPGLKTLIDFGMFSFFAYPLLEILKFFHKFVGNYGVAIILLTLLVRALFYPLSIKSFKSMKQMQKLQPQIQALKEKYKNDMKRQNEEQMALFKTHGVNPMGGCLPMLVQLPVFIALYAVLGNSIELFHAPFFGWVLDLSTKDPFYIYPALMGVAMFAQQKITPSAGMDPAQQKIMLFMPIIFTVMMVGLPAGLTLYIFVSTLLGITQQWSMMRDNTKTTTITKPAVGT